MKIVKQIKNLIEALKLLALLLLLVGGNNVAAQQPEDSGLRPVDSFTSTIQVSHNSQTANLEAVLLSFTNNLAADNIFIGFVFVLWDPKSGLSWWDSWLYYGKGPVLKLSMNPILDYMKQSDIYLSDGGIIAIEKVIPTLTRLMVRQFSEKHSSLEEAKSWAFKSFKDYLGKSKKLRPDYQEIQISDYIPQEFFTDYSRTNSGNEAKLESAHKENGVLTVSLSGRNNMKVDVEINEQYQVTKTTLYPNYR